MEYEFEQIRASARSQLSEIPEPIDDSEDVISARQAAVNADVYKTLGDALSRQWRYREAAEAYGAAYRLDPENIGFLRLRCGRLLSTLQLNEAKSGLTYCLENGWDELDARYRLGLCGYMLGDYTGSAEHLARCLTLCGDEMGIAAIYWHTLCALRSGAEPGLLAAYHSGMDVGHHAAYEKAVRVFCGEESLPDALAELGAEPDDLEYGITAYGLSVLLQSQGEGSESRRLAENVIHRDSFWPCYAWLAAWNDRACKKPDLG